MPHSVLCLPMKLTDWNIQGDQRLFVRNKIHSINNNKKKSGLWFYTFISIFTWHHFTNKIALISYLKCKSSIHLLVQYIHHSVPYSQRWLTAAQWEMWQPCERSQDGNTVDVLPCACANRPIVCHVIQEGLVPSFTRRIPVCSVGSSLLR